jgi:hypothetical protein
VRPLSIEVTHILAEATSSSLLKLQKQLICESIPSEVSILNINWLIKSVEKREKVEEAAYIITTDENVQRTVGEKTSISSSSTTSSSSSSNDENKRQKTNTVTILDLSSETTETPLGVEGRHPIIANSIIFPDFNPVYGSWQSFKSVLYKIHSPSGSSSRSISLDLTGGT